MSLSSSRAALCAVGVLALAVAVSAGMTSPDLGPARRDADGRFLNEAGVLRQAGLDVTVPFFLRRAAGAVYERPGAPERVPNDGAFLRENAAHSVPTVTWIGIRWMSLRVSFEVCGRPEFP